MGDGTGGGPRLPDPGLDDVVVAGVEDVESGGNTDGAGDCSYSGGGCTAEPLLRAYALRSLGAVAGLSAFRAAPESRSLEISRTAASGRRKPALLVFLSFRFEVSIRLNRVSQAVC
jgi:hypothetical protein